MRSWTAQTQIKSSSSPPASASASPFSFPPESKPGWVVSWLVVCILLRREKVLFLCSCIPQLSSPLWAHGLLLAMLKSGHPQHSSTLILVSTGHVSAASQLSKGIVSLDNLNKCHLFSGHICVPVFTAAVDKSVSENSTVQTLPSLPGWRPSQGHTIFSNRFLGFHSSCWLVPGASAPT